MNTFGGMYGDAFEEVKTWLINPIKYTVDFIIDNALKLAAGILAVPIFLFTYPFRKIAASGLFNGPPKRPNRYANPGPKTRPADRGGTGVGQSDGEIETLIDVSPAECKRKKQELGFEDNKIYIAVIGGTGVGKSSLVNGLRGLKNKGTGSAPVGETDCTKTMSFYPDPRYPWIVWCDIPGAGTQDRSTTTYFEEQALYLMDFVLVVCSTRVKNDDMAILKRAHHYEIPAALVRSKADQDLRERAKRDCEDDDNEDEIGNKVKIVKQGYVKEVKENLMNEIEKAGLQELITSENCFLVSSQNLREFMRNSKDLPALKDLDDKDCQNKSEEVKAAVKKHIENIFSNGDDIDEIKLLEVVFTSLAKTRY